MPLRTKVLDTPQFKAAVNTLSSSNIEKTSSINEIVFMTNDFFYRPSGSQFISSFDTKSGNVDVYIFDSSIYMLCLSKTGSDEYKHSLYSTTSSNGFTLNEMIEIISDK